jgi:hypothetical protein
MKRSLESWLIRLEREGDRAGAIRGGHPAGEASREVSGGPDRARAQVRAPVC